MNFLSSFDDFGDFIVDVKASILNLDKSQEERFNIFANEARFGLSVIRDDLSSLPHGAEIMEIGAGILLLSGYLVFKGFRVIALEPIGEGFSLFRVLQNAVLKHYEHNGVHIDIVESQIEHFSKTERFDYVFSINVFEHIGNVELGLVNSYLSLRVGGKLRVYCPNYLFPYEPHFNIPTLLNKRLTELVFKSTILRSATISEAKQVWDGLNWIDILRVKKSFRERFKNEPDFNRMATYQIAKRMLDDRYFMKRHAGWITAFLKTLDRRGLIQLLRFVPLLFSPVLDFWIQRDPLQPGNV